MRWRGTLICLIATVFLVGLSVPLIETLSRQVRSMVPSLTKPIQTQVYASVLRRIQEERHILPARRVLTLIANRNTADLNLDTFRQADANNSLYTYLELLLLLRQEESLSSPAELDTQILKSLYQITTEPPTRIYTRDQYNLAQAAFLDAGLSLRRSAVETERIRPAFYILRESHRPVLRELADRLIQKGNTWDKLGRSRDAQSAYAAVVKLFSDLVKDSPTPDIALLAAEKLPSALRKLDGETQARQVEAFHQRWHEAIQEDRINLLPNTGDLVLSSGAHDRVLRSFCSAGLSAAVWLTLALTCLISLAIVAATRPSSNFPILWGLGGRGSWAAPAIVCAPLVILLLIVASIDIQFFTWLLSLKSLPVIIFSPALLIITVGLATRVCVKPSDNKSSVPTWGICSFALLLAATLLAGLALLPMHTEPWRPPAAIQYFRKLGFLIGFESTVIMVIWTVWGFVRRRRAGIPAGIAARSTLGVVSAALLAVSLICFASLVVNHRCDRKHQEAFARAAADPVTDRLGPNWQTEHFAGAKLLLEKTRTGQ